MKTIEGLGYYKINGQLVTLVSDDYRGSPPMYLEYHTLICSHKTLAKYKDSLIAPHMTKNGWFPIIVFTDKP